MPRSGETVAVSAAAGGVGTIVVQLLVRDGIRVLGIASAANAERLAELGAIPVVYGERLAERLTAAAPDGVDAFIDLFGPEYVMLAEELGVAPERIETTISFGEAARIGAKTAGSVAGSTPEILAALAELAATGAIRIPIAATFPLENVREAFAELEQRHTHGKIVLIPNA